MADLTVIGIHVSGGTLRRAELLRRDGQIEVLRLEAMPFTPGTGGAARVVSGRAEGGSPNGARLVAAVPAGDVMSRCWPLPPLDAQKLRQLVAHQLEADLPVPMDQITWGYRQAAGENGGKRAVLAQAVRSERVARYMSSLAAAGVGVDLLTTEAEGFAGLYRHGLKPAGPGPEPEALLLAGPAEWLLCVFGGGLAQVVRRIRVEADHLDTACRECRQVLGAGLLPEPVKRIRLCAAPPSPDLHQLLADICGVDVETAEPGDGLVLPDGGRLAPEHLAEFGLAIGLALAWPSDGRESPIRLAGQEHPDRAEPLQRLGGLLVRPWVWTAVAAVLLAAAMAIHVGSLRAQARRMQESLDRGSAGKVRLDELRPKIRAMQRLEMYRIDVEGICAEICAAVKDLITISSLQLSREHRLVLKGASKDPKATFTFADDLRKGRRFKNVRIEKTSPGQGGDFVISMEPAGVARLSSPALRGAR